MLGLIMGAGVLGIIIALMEEGEFPGWGKMIVCVLAAVVPAALVNIVVTARIVLDRVGHRRGMCGFGDLGDLWHERQTSEYRCGNLSGVPSRAHARDAYHVPNVSRGQSCDFAVVQDRKAHILEIIFFFKPPLVWAEGRVYFFTAAWASSSLAFESLR